VNRTSDSNNPLNGSAAGAVVGYDQVTELIGENGEYGQKVYRYNNTPDYVPPFSDPVSQLNLGLRPPYGSNIPNALNGTLIEETDYANTNGSLTKVKDVTNTYETVLASRNYLYALAINKVSPVNLGDNCFPIFTQDCDASTLALSYVAMPSEWQRIYSTDEKDYNEGDSVNYLDTYTHYIYDNPAHQQVTRAVTTNSKGQKVTTTTQYPLDFPNPTATDAFTLGIAKLQQSHIVTRPVEIHIDKSNQDGSNQRTISAYLNYFNSSTPTESAVFRTESAIPITGFTSSSISSSGLTSNSNYVPFLLFDQYDAFGNILQQHKAGDLLHSYIWDYATSLVTAEVTNAAQSDIAFTSFESDGTGNWTLGSSVTFDGGITGAKYYNLGNGAISKSGLQTGKSYVVSYWSQNGAYSISGGAGSVKTGKTINSWTYYEHTVVTSYSTLTINGGGHIDELRLYPADAQMVSYTYVPLVGMTSQCDVANRISYYEYDALARLQDVRDQDGNIVKTYEYQYKLPVSSGGQ
jgi:YD repeat-containing protein